jgi:hypothetical protein
LAYFKNRTVRKELNNNSWIQAVRHISTAEELHEFINLWMKIRTVNLSQSGKDEIIWKWTPNGEYTARSAYRIQFYGSYPSFQVGNLWKERAEPKVRVFRWTAMHQKILTADNLASRGMQPNPFALSAIRVQRMLGTSSLTVLSLERFCGCFGPGSFYRVPLRPVQWIKDLRNGCR